MPQRYKLRLGDGSVVSANADELGSFAGESGGMAQAVGTSRWRPLEEVIAEEEAAARLARALVPPKPRHATTPTPPPPAAPPLELPEFDLGAEAEAPAPQPRLQVLADEPVSTRYSEPAPEEPADDLPVIPMKPVDDEPAFQSAWAGGQDYEEEEDEAPRTDRLDGPLLSLLAGVGGFLSRCLDRLSPFADRLSSREPATGPRHKYGPLVEASRRGAAKHTAPEVLALAEDPGTGDALDREEDEDDQPSLYARVSAWASGLVARARRPPSAEPVPAAKGLPAVPAAAPPAPPPPAPTRKPVAAPTPLSELPALRFVESHEPRERADVYQGHAPSRGLDLYPLWLLTKRVVIVAALVAGGYYAVVERDTWFPIAANLGQTVFSELDRRVLSRERAAEQRRALEAASERLPQLDPETIRLVFSRSPIGWMEAPEVFQIASEAADRGLAALGPSDAEELRGLRRELLETLSRTERARVREYDQTRARRVIFPFENPHVMELVARGARALPPARLERLRALSHQAVAAGLAAPDPPVASAAAR